MSFTWSKDSLAITGNSSSHVSVTHVMSSTRLVIENIGLEDAGEYVCSRPGFTSINATLNVTVPAGLLVILCMV